MVIAIIGVLAAVAIPAYNKYKADAEVNTVLSTIANIKKAFNICLASGTAVGNCASPDVNETISVSGSGDIDFTPGTATNPGCWLVRAKGTGGGTNAGCVQLDENGSVSAESDAATIRGSATTCSTSGVCTP